MEQQQIHAELEIATLLRDYNKINTEIKSLEKEKDKLKTDILINMKIAGIEGLETETHSVKYSMQKRKVLDKKALEKFLSEHNRNYESFTIVNEYEMLKVMQKGDLNNEEGE